MARTPRFLRAGRLSIVALSLLPLSAQGIKPAWLFRNRAYYEPLSAEPHAAQTQVLFPARSSSFPFAVNPGQSWAWDISLGKEFPIIGWETNPTTRSDRGVAPRSFGVGVWFPLSFHMIEDMSKDESAPILNTDYRFSGMVKAQWGLPPTLGPVKEGHIGLRYVFWGHESTHIGDEFTLGATRKYQNEFKRVNVSYEYWELGGSFEPNFGEDGQHQFTFRGGLIRPFNQQKGWYNDELLQPFGERVTPSKRNYEPYVGAEFFCSPGDEGYGPFVSLDIRKRTIYTYFRPTGETEPTQASFNLLAGVRHRRKESVIQPSYYLRYYHGVNPAGQFRSQKNYQLFGFGVQFSF